MTAQQVLIQGVLAGKPVIEIGSELLACQQQPRQDTWRHRDEMAVAA